MINKLMTLLLNQHKHKTTEVMIRYNNNLYPANNLFMENGVLHLRSLVLLTDNEKAECDVTCEEELEKMTGEELASKLAGYEDNVEIWLDLPDGNFDCFCYVKNDNIIKLYPK